VLLGNFVVRWILFFIKIQVDSLLKGVFDSVYYLILFLLTLFFCFIASFFSFKCFGSLNLCLGLLMVLA